ncbi:hypothetical protein DYD21_19675 [Rhodohalobacter sp. SW132]|nr:hypothetical protein DYD21_19675 [Rhodohalobacter sp. SW132]
MNLKNKVVNSPELLRRELDHNFYYCKFVNYDTVKPFPTDYKFFIVERMPAFICKDGKCLDRLGIPLRWVGTRNAPAARNVEDSLREC